MKTGRNDPCPCGSGKKYKHCCLAAAAAVAETPSELAWRRIRRANEGLIGKMLRFVAETYGPAAFDDAWEEFTLDVIDEDPETSTQRSIFLPWMLHHWAPDPYETSVSDAVLHDVPPTREFLRRKASSLDPISRRYLEACLVSPYSFHEIVDCTPSVGFRTKDLLTGEIYDVLERSGSQTLKQGDVLFASLVRCDGIVMMEGTAPAPIPPIHKIEILELRNFLAERGEVTSDALRVEWDFEVRGVYLDIIDNVLNPRLPELHNTDGDKLALQRLIYDIDSAQDVFDALKHLSLEEDADALLADAERDRHGQLVRVSFSWLKRGNRIHKEWDNTALGTIRISAKRLIVETNSDKRATKFKGIAKKVLGKLARYRATEMESIERALGDPRVAQAAEDAQIAADPAVQAKMNELLSQHYDRWLTEKIPALRGKTPLQAAKNAQTREMVEALVAQIELDGKRMSPPLDAEIPRRLRERLGLTPRQG